MSFHASAQDISLDGTVLRANLVNIDGEAVGAEINLNDLIGNDNGSLRWDGAGFADSAEEIYLSLESDDNLPILRAKLRDGEGEWQEANINLSERLGNNNGEFAFA